MNSSAMSEDRKPRCGTDTKPSARVDSAKFFTDETALWAKVIKDINIEVQ